MMSLWGSLNICPCLNYLELPSHSSGELLSISSLKIWRDIQELHNDMVYLLVCIGDALEAQIYGISLVWINPNQVQVSTTEEVVGTLFTYISSGPDWPYALAQLYKGSSHTPSQRASIWASYPKERWRRAPMDRLANLKSASSFPLGHESSIL